MGHKAGNQGVVSALLPLPLPRVPPSPTPHPPRRPPRSLVGYSGNRGDRGGDARFQRWDERLGRSAPRVQDMSALVIGGCGRSG
jgi:hypothetical protein